MKIAFVNRTRRAVEARSWQSFLRRLSSFLDPPEGTLTVLFCGDEEMAALNGAWRGKARPTDVLSFEGGGATAEGRAHLGDLAISLDTASRQARRAGHSLRREIEMLLAHGLLHLMGYDHETDDGTMLRLQAKALAAARMPRPRRGPAATRAGRGRNGRRARPAARVRGGHGTKARR